jgi:MFS family permease
VQLQYQDVDRDRRILYTVGFLRAVTTSATGILFGSYIATLGLGGLALGIVGSAGLAGATLAAIAATFLADRLGARRFLIAVTACGALGTAVFALTASPIALAAAAFVGMVNSMGKDRGAALILEQAMLPATTTAEQRTRAIAVYTMLQDIGHALGALVAGIPAWLAASTSLGAIAPYRLVLVQCAAIALVTLVLYAMLRHAPAPAKITLTPDSRGILTKISALFALDGLGGGFLSPALVGFFFIERFGVSGDTVAVLYFGARLLNATSHLGAAWLARRIGLVNTMVFTHIPSSLLLVTVAFAPSFSIAAVLFLIREGLVEMDVPTRQSYVLAVVQPEERAVASGVTTLVRLAAWAVAPAIAGVLMTGDALYVPLVIGATMKITYDLLLWRAFRELRPPEERIEA